MFTLFLQAFTPKWHSWIKKYLYSYFQKFPISVFSHLHSHRKHTIIPSYLNLHQHLCFFFFNFLGDSHFDWCKMGSQLVLIFISLMAKKEECVCVCVWSICIFFLLERCLLTSFTYLFLGLFPLLAFKFFNSLHILELKSLVK